MTILRGENMYKIFKITYNDGGWHSGVLPHFFYIARNKEDVIDNSREYKRFLESKECWGGDIWISEVSGLAHDFEFENLKDFDITVSVKEKS